MVRQEKHRLAEEHGAWSVEDGEWEGGVGSRSSGERGVGAMSTQVRFPLPKLLFEVIFILDGKGGIARE